MTAVEQYLDTAEARFRTAAVELELAREKYPHRAHPEGDLAIAGHLARANANLRMARTALALAEKEIGADLGLRSQVPARYTLKELMHG